jgi:hypothetical protein
MSHGVGVGWSVGRGDAVALGDGGAIVPDGAARLRAEPETPGVALPCAADPQPAATTTARTPTTRRVGTLFKGADGGHLFDRV